MTTRLPVVLTTAEFAYLLRYSTEAVRRMIRSHVIKSSGRPARIPSQELLKFGVDLERAAELLAVFHETKQQPQLAA